MFIEKRTLKKFIKAESSGTSADAVEKGGSSDSPVTAEVCAASGSPNSLKKLGHSLKLQIGTEEP